MKIVKLKGGLGNQMFQYAFAKMLQAAQDDIVKIDCSWVEKYDAGISPLAKVTDFKLSLPIAKDEDIQAACLFHHPHVKGTQYKLGIILEIMLNRNYYFEMGMMPKDVMLLKKSKYFDGYWQAWRYVNEIYEELKNDFVPRNSISHKTLASIEKAKKENSVFLGVRRGDYLKYRKTYGTFGIDYYSKAMQYIERKVDNPVYYVFSNDINWVEENMDFGDREIVFRKREDVVNDFEELIFMASCKHSIIQNSTFHWWGARMNYYEGKIVIAPDKWFYDRTNIDIVPPEWVKIENPQC